MRHLLPTMLTSTLVLTACEEKEGPRCAPPARVCDQSQSATSTCTDCDELWFCTKTNHDYVWEYNGPGCDCLQPDGGIDSDCYGGI